MNKEKEDDETVCERDRSEVATQSETATRGEGGGGDDGAKSARWVYYRMCAMANRAMHVKIGIKRRCTCEVVPKKKEMRWRLVRAWSNTNAEKTRAIN